ncbi:uncharacterized protein TNCV_351271 [Trichonephila clavipes]|nr:uncharacterized protein TNCV_351271 [Trichonephila clavipes]
MNLTWRNPPAHHWYAAKSPGLSIQFRSSRAHQTASARLRSGHLRSMTFVQGSPSRYVEEIDSRKSFSPTISGSNTIRSPSPTSSSGVKIIIVTEPNTAEETSCSRAIHVKSVEAQTSSHGVM